MLGQVLTLVTLTSAGASGGTPPPSPSVAVSSLENKTGVNADVAELLTDNVVNEVRQSRAFSRVVSAKEIQAALGYEQQKQLMNCNSESCMAQIAAALEVTHLITGNIGRLGGSYLFNLKLIDARTGVAAGAVAQRIPASSDEALLDTVRPSVDQLLRQAGIPSRRGAEEGPLLASVPTQAVAAPAPSTDPQTSESPQGPASWRRPVLLAGGGGVLVSVLVGVVAAGLAASTAYVLADALLLPQLPAPQVSADSKLLTAGVLGAAWGAVSILAVVFLLAAAGLLGTGVIAGGG
ncbi:MAG: hypothetical protein AB2A00_36275 [Myxococcota bacterium]